MSTLTGQKGTGMNKSSAVEIIENALRENRRSLSEYEAKQFLASYNFPVVREILVERRNEVQKATQQIGYPLVAKGCSHEIAHKTEKGLIRVDIRNENEALEAFDEISEKLNGYQGAVLLQEMVQGSRELVMGLTRDDQFGPCVMFGLGGIFTEVLKDVSFRKAPLRERDAMEMMREIKGNKIIDELRGMEAVDIKTLTGMLIEIGRIGLEYDRVREIDINPVIIYRSKPVVVDALMILG
jgi:acetyl-CoA synthetase (ADP-forming)